MELESAHACGGLLMEGEKRENTTCDEWKNIQRGTSIEANTAG